MMGIIWEWCCMCPVYVGMSHATDLGLRGTMVAEEVVMKNFSHEWVVAKISHEWMWSH